jgi:peroxiredoxin
VTPPTDTPTGAPNPQQPGLGRFLDRLPKPMRIALPILVIAAIGIAIVVIQRTGDAGSDDTLSGALDSGTPAKGEPAPDFALPTLDGEQVRLSSLRGTPVVLNFWATWCAPCKAEMPEIEAAYAGAQGEFVVLAVNSEGTPTNMARRLAGDFRDEMELSFPILLDSPSTEVYNQYRLRGLPDTFFIDRDGIIRDVVIGPLTESALREKLDALLAR